MILQPNGRPAIERIHTEIADAFAVWARNEVATGTAEARLIVVLIDTLAAILANVDDGQPTKEPLMRHTLARLAAGLARLDEQHGKPGRSTDVH